MATIANSCTFTLLEFAVFGSDKVDINFDVLPDEFFPQEFACFLSVECLTRVRESVEDMRITIGPSTNSTCLGPRVELSCRRRSTFKSFSTTEIWSPDQMRTTVASNTWAWPFDGAPPFDFPVAAAAGALAYKQRRRSLATFSAARRRSIPPWLASIPACQSTMRARPEETRNSAIFPAGWETCKKKKTDQTSCMHYV